VARAVLVAVAPVAVAEVLILDHTYLQVAVAEQIGTVELGNQADLVEVAPKRAAAAVLEIHHQ
jgi:hypothetical protein